MPALFKAELKDMFANQLERFGFRRQRLQASQRLETFRVIWSITGLILVCPTNVLPLRGER